MAEAMFFEARGEEYAGYYAVGRNILKRLETSYRGAENTCEVIHTPSQYSYLWDDIPDVVMRKELHLYNEITKLAEKLILQYATSSLPEYEIGECKGGATHYHSTTIKDPYWTDSMDQYCGKIGKHKFYIGA